jgi:hypothetical protein
VSVPLAFESFAVVAWLVGLASSQPTKVAAETNNTVLAVNTALRDEPDATRRRSVLDAGAFWQKGQTASSMRKWR